MTQKVRLPLGPMRAGKVPIFKKRIIIISIHIITHTTTVFIFIFIFILVIVIVIVIATAIVLLIMIFLLGRQFVPIPQRPYCSWTQCIISDLGPCGWQCPSRVLERQKS